MNALLLGRKIHGCSKLLTSLRIVDEFKPKIIIGAFQINHGSLGVAKLHPWIFITAKVHLILFVEIRGKGIFEKKMDWLNPIKT